LVGVGPITIGRTARKGKGKGKERGGGQRRRLRERKGETERASASRRRFSRDDARESRIAGRGRTCRPCGNESCVRFLETRRRILPSRNPHAEREKEREQERAGGEEGRVRETPRRREIHPVGVGEKARRIRRRGQKWPTGASAAAITTKKSSCAGQAASPESSRVAVCVYGRVLSLSRFLSLSSPGDSLNTAMAMATATAMAKATATARPADIYHFP